jgi:MATE family multidrug resistance protein
MLALPVVVYYLLNFTLNFSSVISLGHLGTKELAASALATMFCNVTGFSLGQGRSLLLRIGDSLGHTLLSIIHW